MKTALIATATALAVAEAAPAAPGAAKISLTRLDCGSIHVKDFNAFFSDSFDYKPGPREITDSCYLVRHLNQYLLWDTGLPAALKGKKMDAGPVVAALTLTVPEQLTSLGFKPDDLSVVAISHMPFDHTGQASAFPKAAE